MTPKDQLIERIEEIISEIEAVNRDYCPSSHWLSLREKTKLAINTFLKDKVWECPSCGKEVEEKAW